MLMPSRHLNNEKTIFGLNLWDLLVSLSILSVFNYLFENTKLELLSIPIALTFLIFLIPIRTRHRRKYIRDFLWFHLTSRVIYDPRFISKHKSHRDY